jgi:hypothetical protein
VRLTPSLDLICFHVAGFEIRDAIALLRLDDLYVEGFEVKDVKVRAFEGGQKRGAAAGPGTFTVTQ